MLKLSLLLCLCLFADCDFAISIVQLPVELPAAPADKKAKGQKSAAPAASSSGGKGGAAAVAAASKKEAEQLKQQQMVRHLNCVILHMPRTGACCMFTACAHHAVFFLLLRQLC